MSDDDFKLSVHIQESMYGSLIASDCEKVGMWGGCGLDCWVYQDGRCKNSEELIERFETEDDTDTHNRLYGTNLKVGETE